MQHSNVLRRQNVHASARVNVPDLDEARLKGEDIRVRQRKGLRLTLPIDAPVWTRPPAVAVHEEAKVRVVE